MCLLSTRNATFSKLLAQVIKFRAHHHDYPIKSIRLDYAGEFTSKTFNDYCMLVRVKVEHPVPHVHTQNGLADAFIKRLQMIARSHQDPDCGLGPCNIARSHVGPPEACCDQTIPDISRLRIFYCVVYVLILLPLRNGASAKYGNLCQI
ncbi:hypothetical protein ACFX2H_034931 [Malus domestica]